MTRLFASVSAACTLALLLTSAPAAAQDPPVAPSAPTSAATDTRTALRANVVISRYKGEKQIASIPYALALNAVPAPQRGQVSQLKMGSQVPIVRGGQPGKEPAGYVYQNIGTQIDCSASALGDGRFELNISIEDSSVYVDDEAVHGVATSGGPAIMRSFQATNQLLLRDGQTTEFTAATDRISDEVIRVSITLTVLD